MEMQSLRGPSLPYVRFNLPSRRMFRIKPLSAVNTTVKKPESIKSVVKKPETAVAKSFSRPTPELRHRDVLNHSVRKFV